MLPRPASGPAQSPVRASRHRSGDTPARGLFSRDQRSFSHGCIRVENPEQFGAFVLDGQQDRSFETIHGAIATGQRMVVGLEQPRPVHIAHLTAWVNKDGTVHFRRDVYGRDEILAAALLGPEAYLTVSGRAAGALERDG